MASARSTVSIARTTPAQKPRGEHNITFNCGFAEGREDVMSRGPWFRLTVKRRQRGRIWFFAHADVKTAPTKRQKLNRNTINNGRPEPVEVPLGARASRPRSQGVK